MATGRAKSLCLNLALLPNTLATLSPCRGGFSTYKLDLNPAGHEPLFMNSPIAVSSSLYRHSRHDGTESKYSIIRIKQGEVAVYKCRSQRVAASMRDIVRPHFARISLIVDDVTKKPVAHSWLTSGV
jgi:hypothetical protein